MGLHGFLFETIMQNGLYKPGFQLLDIGCGTGAWLGRFPDALQRMGIDLDTRQFGLKNATCLALNIDEYAGQQWGQYHLITAFEIIEHLENPGKLFSIIKNNLTAEGNVMLSTPNIHSLPARLRFMLTGRLPHFDDKSDATHIYPVYIENIKRLLPRYGLKLDKLFFYPKKGYSVYSKTNMLLQPFLKMAAPDHLPGDNLILLISRL